MRLGEAELLRPIVTVKSYRYEGHTIKPTLKSVDHQSLRQSAVGLATKKPTWCPCRQESCNSQPVKLKAVATVLRPFKLRIGEVGKKIVNQKQ